jgi:hypothetical protein
MTKQSIAVKDRHRALWYENGDADVWSNAQQAYTPELRIDFTEAAAISMTERRRGVCRQAGATARSKRLSNA